MIYPGAYPTNKMVGGTPETVREQTQRRSDQGYCRVCARWLHGQAYSAAWIHAYHNDAIWNKSKYFMEHVCHHLHNPLFTITLTADVK